MGFLTDQERRSLQIVAMILHVVGEDPFIPETARAVEHEGFFVGRILDTDVAPVYSFKEGSATCAQLERMARSEVTFEAGAQDLSREFSRFHGTTSREGAFFIFQLATDDPRTTIYSLVKYDYREAIEQAEGEQGASLLRRIVHAFIADKKAIQKSALVRVVDGRAEAAISAHDRIKPAPEIGEYFARFLDVDRSRSDQELNEAVVDVLRQTLKDSRADRTAQGDYGGDGETLGSEPAADGGGRERSGDRHRPGRRTPHRRRAADTGRRRDGRRHDLCAGGDRFRRTVHPPATLHAHRLAAAALSVPAGRRLRTHGRQAGETG